MKRIWVALEVDFLLTLMLGEENSTASIDLINKIGGFPIATPSVMQELADQARNGKDEAFRGTAQKTLVALNTWNVLTPSLGWKEHALADSAAKKLLQRGFCSSYQRALILSEASVSGSKLLLTYRRPVDPEVLTLFFVEQDLSECINIPPHWFVNYFGSKKGE